MLSARDARAAGAVIGKEGETVTVSTARVAVATTPGRTALWAQVAVTGASAGFVWILPVRPGARIDLGSDAWLDALDAATSPVVLPPSTATPNTCDVGLSPQRIPPTASPQSALPGAIGLFTDPVALESFVTDAGYAIPPGLASALGTVFAGGAVIAATYAAADRPVRTLRIVDSGPPLLPFALTGAPESTTQATAFVIASAGATAGSSPVSLDPSRIAWVSDGLSSFVQARANLVDLWQGTRWLTESAAPGLLFNGAAIGPAATLPAVVGQYFSLARGYGDATGLAVSIPRESPSNRSHQSRICWTSISGTLGTQGALMVRMVRGVVIASGWVGLGSLVIAGVGGCSTTSAGAAAATDGSAEAATVVVDAPSDAPIACTTGSDCRSLFSAEPLSGSSVPCCTDKVCRFEPYDDCTEANAQLILASNYDQSCMTDKECVAVAEGNFCSPGAGNCGNAAIRMNAYAQYQADVAKTRAASCFAPGNCGSETGPCCSAGKCLLGSQCAPAVLLGDATAESGMSDGGDNDCFPSNTGTTGGADTFDLTVDDTGFSKMLLTTLSSAQVTLTLTNNGTKPHGFKVGCTSVTSAYPTLPAGCPTTACFDPSASIAPLAPGASRTISFETPVPDNLIYPFTSNDPDDSAVPGLNGGQWSLM